MRLHPTAPIPFSKLSGTGNDFIIIDNRQGLVPAEAMPDFVRAVCRRAVSVGADGAIFIEAHTDLDFQWRFFNSDGSEAEMCGNGSRCAGRFAFERGIAGKEMKFLTLAGVIQATVTGPETVRVRLTKPGGHRKFRITGPEGEGIEGDFLNTGVPHAIVRVKDIEATDVRGLGRFIRRHEEFAPAGTNANFIQIAGTNDLVIRTYERGVEDETLACGTGCVASALTSAVQGIVDPPVRLLVRSGERLTVDFDRKNPLTGDLFLEGPVRWVYDGVLKPEAIAEG